jgi:ribonuclease BN (tRNA processing enzyme)
MQVTFWGTRGSIAKAGPTTLRYGGNTSCVSVRSDAGTQIVIDAGTGAHGLGQALVGGSDGRPIDGHILISHTHWDHIQGLPFFAPLFVAGNRWEIYGPSGLGGSLSEILAGQMEYRYFPVAIDQLSADVHHHDLVEGSFDIAEVTVDTQYLNHPALTLGYRLEVDGATVVYASDHEPHDHDLAEGGRIAQNRHDDAHARFAAGADLLIHDAQYLASEYDEHIGWGHSTVEYVIDIAHHADVGSVALYHHDPTRTDPAVDRLVAIAQAHAESIGYRGAVFGAAEGMTVELRSGTRTPRVRDRATEQAATSALVPEARSAVVFARTPVIARALADVARAEHLEVFASDDLRSTFEAVRSNRPGIVLAEAVDDDGDFDLAMAIRGLDAPYGVDVPLVMVGPASARWRPDADETRITEWLVWPASEFYLRTKLRSWLLRRASRWENAPVAPHEDARIASLHALGILDTEPEARFDRYTEEMARKLEVPIALVTLVDVDRQWFKSRQGIDVAETPRDASFCAHAILEPDVMQVPDTLADSRFAQNPLVIGGPRIRFYAGMPLTLSDGSNVGTLCVADVLPRLLDDEQLDMLRRTAASVVGELESPVD